VHATLHKKQNLQKYGVCGKLGTLAYSQLETPKGQALAFVAFV